MGTDIVYFDRTTNPSTRSVCVTSKSSSDGGSWSFSYTPGSYNSYDTTVASTPAGSITYKHIGASYGVQPFVWSIGLLVQRTAGGVQTETYAWGKQTISNQTNTRVGAFTQFSDPAVYAPVLTQRTIVRDGVTYQTTYSNHDAYGNPQTVAEAGSYAGNRTTNLSYYINTGKWIVRQVQNETTVGVGSVTRGFDGNGNLLSESHDGVRTGYSRYSTGDIYVKTPPRGAIGAITYSNYYRGIPQTEAQPEGVTISRVVNDAGDVTSQTDGEQKTTAYSYDGLHQLTLITPPVGNATTISYTATAKTATRGSSPELVQTTTLDGFGRIVNVTTGGVAVARQYDALGRKIFASIMGFTSVGHSYLYDILNRVTRITHSADGSWRGYTYGNSSGSAKVDVRDERGNTTTYTYRAYGDPDRNFVMGVSTPVAAASVAIRRNGRDLVTQVTQGGVTRSYGYDSRYYLTSSVQPEVGTTTYGRDNAGNMASKQVGSSGSTVFEYDGRNRPWRVTYPNGNPSQVVSTYWRTDKLKTVTNAVATRSYGYDANQNLISESLVVDGLTMTAGYNYNGNDQLASIVYPVMGRTVQFNPNVLGRPTSIVTPAGSMLATGFWPNGQIYDIAFAGGSRVTYGQNGREWLNSVTVQTGDGISRIASTLGHDVAGNLGTVTDSADASYNRTLGFDGINRLTVINGPWGNGALAYDGAGNRTSYTLGAQTRSYSYDSQQRLVSLALNRAFGGVTTSYGYDTYGNAFPSTNTYAYDNASNLTSTITGRFSYDGLNTRVKTVVSYVTTYEFRSAQGLLLAEWQKEPGYYDTLKEHMHLAGKEVAEQRTQFLGGDIRPVTWMFLQPDASGSPLASTWAGGGLLFKENYRPYGSQINGTAKAYTQRAFAGQTQDEYELIYMGGRYYNPVAGRFLSMDPKEADPSDPHGINRYAYANNNPYRYVDPDGHSPVDLAFLAIDTVQLARALYNGEGRGEAAINFGISVVGVVSPLVGTGQLIKALRVADKAVEGAEAAGHAVLAAKGEAALTSRAARREAMREAGIPTSQQPVSQSRNASGREYSYDVPAPGGGTQRMSVQQQTMDRSHPGQAHWEAGRVKTDPRTGAIRESNYGRPALTNDKSKVDY